MSLFNASFVKRASVGIQIIPISWESRLFDSSYSDFNWSKWNNMWDSIVRSFLVNIDNPPPIFIVPLSLPYHWLVTITPTNELPSPSSIHIGERRQESLTVGVSQGLFSMGTVISRIHAEIGRTSPGLNHTSIEFSLAGALLTSSLAYAILAVASKSQCHLTSLGRVFKRMSAPTLALTSIRTSTGPHASMWKKLCKALKF